MFARFNPIAATLMKRALQNLVNKHFAGDRNGLRPSKNVLDMIVESSNGDIRSAIMALQFACVPTMHAVLSQSGGRVRSLSRKSSEVIQGREVLEAVTKREQSLALFHLIGKLLYNKRRHLRMIHDAYLLIMKPKGKGILLRPLHQRRIFNEIMTLIADCATHQSCPRIYDSTNEEQVEWMSRWVYLLSVPPNLNPNIWL